MADCSPTYLIVYHQEQPIARATYWRSPNEPLPMESEKLRNIIQPIFNRWPLFMCYSPLCSLSGLILPDSPLREDVKKLITMQVTELLHKQGCSFVLFPYLSKEQFADWPKDLMSTVIPGPGTIMKVIWPNFEAYLQAGDKKDRQHYKRTVREAEKLNIVIQRHNQVERVDEALELIRNVEKRFGSAENPWARKMLEEVQMSNGTFLAATIDGKLVGCGLVLQDNGAQMNATLGLAPDVPYVYFMLVYESLKLAFDNQISLLRMGSGAYDVKEQLGFSLEDNNSLLFAAANPLLQKAGQWLSKL
jgi:predicted N-acyltransferase